MMLLKFILRNALRHRLRTSLTALGIFVAILAFGLLSTVIEAWFSGVNTASSSRIITRSSVSLVFPLPATYREKLRQVEGVTGVAGVNWFGGVYQETKNFFPQFAVDPEDYFPLYPEYLIPEPDYKEFLRDRKGAIVGRKLANTYGWKVGDVVPLKGMIYPGNWEFVVRAIYDGRDSKVDTSQFFFHWDYLNERVKILMPRRANYYGLYVLGIADPDRAAETGRVIDAQFRNSLAETLTETERAFQLSFVSMVETLVVAIRVVSYLVIFIIMAVMANTMAMSARERLSEYATLKALGFKPFSVGGLIVGESMAIALIGGALGVLATFPVAELFRRLVGSLFPVFEVSQATVVLQFVCAAVVGMVAAVIPSVRAARVQIAAGLRAVA
ncbi:MAG: ABC transporter permease [Burkholderiales bacterium]|nr:ABC transporter permease [Burkholderiales bacterium]